jgi:hypothetical protein
MYFLFYSVFCMCCPLCPSLWRRLTGNKGFLTIASSRWDTCVGIRIHRCWNQESGPCRALCNRCQILISVCPCQSNSTLLHGIEAAFRSLRWNDKEAGADTWNYVGGGQSLSWTKLRAPSTMAHSSLHELQVTYSSCAHRRKPRSLI